ncbi:MAG: isoprenylcysteine carboxylmethyltransferase family protein [Gemmatimonadaceae bacterium]|nr:isoprenylcysteine carboxylmethyltransferase family protein [Gemmatimonadaceae bacterium]
MADERSRGPGVRVPPPVLYALPLLSGFIIQHFVPTHIVSGAGPERIVRLVGWVEIAIALSLMAWAVWTFKRLQTPIIPIRPARTLAQEGPYRLTRNPMYLAFTVLYLGITFAANAFWPLIFLPEAIVLTYMLAIRREEAYLATEFGDAYAQYCSRVRRWV